MRRRHPMLLMLAVVLSSWVQPLGYGSAQTGCEPFLVAVAPQSPGQPLPDNLITLSDPSAVVASAVFEEPRSVEPSPRPGTALVRSLGGVFSLMDTSTGAILPLQIPADEQPLLDPDLPMISNAPSANFMLLASGPTSVWLVELTSGDALDLTAIGQDGPILIDSAAIAPDGNWLIYFAQDMGFVISLREPGRPESIDSEPMVPFPSFDDDNIIRYAVKREGSVIVRSLDPATGRRTDLGQLAATRLLPHILGESLLLVNDRALVLLKSGTSTTDELFEWTERPGPVFSNPAGTHLLVSDERKEETSWFWISFETGIIVEIPELTGTTPVAPSLRRNALLFGPLERIGTGVPGTPYRTFDLTNGSVATPLVQDSTEVFQASPAGDRQGRYALVNAVRPGSGRLWLIDVWAGTASEIARSTGNADARVSPDGCQLALGIYDTVGEGRVSAVSVTPLKDGAAPMTMPDALLLGWA